MRTKLIILLMGLMIAVPNVSFGFGILQYTFDGIKNQLGLDRGPVPKVLPDENPNDPYCRPNPLIGKLHPDRNRMVIQADGF
ncbi:MAG: hypothetical protein WB554_17730 [Desulfomonilaceae bacterium]